MNLTKLPKILTNSLFLGGAVLATSLAAATPAFSQTAFYNWDEGINLRMDDNTDDYKWDKLDNGAGNGGYINVQNSQGYHKSVTTSFDNINNILTWDSVFESREDSTPNGGWLVLTDGSNPKQVDQEYAIFYMDGITRTLSAYAYNGQTNTYSYNTNVFLGSWENAVNIVDNNTDRSMSFSVDVSSLFDVDAINANAINANRPKLDANIWKGTGFGEELGIWFHGSTSPDATYNEDGTLANFTNTGGWFDSEKASLHATITEPIESKPVPEPATMSLLGLGVVGLGASSLKRRKA